MRKGLNVPENLEKAHGPPQKRFERNKWESSIHLLLMSPVCFPKPRCARRDPLRRAKLRLVQCSKITL